MARLSIFDRLAQQLYGPTFLPEDMPTEQETQSPTGPSAVAAGPTTSLYVDDRPAEEVVPPAVVEEPDGGAGDGGPGDGGPGTGGGEVVTTKYKIVGNPPNYSVVEGTDGTYTSQGAAQADADRLNQEWRDKQTQPPTGGEEGPPTPQPPGQPPLVQEPGDPQEAFDAREWSQESYPWLKGQLLETFLDVYDTNGGDVQDALRSLRSTEDYKNEFQGIFREDGKTLRFEGDQPELQYIKMKEDFNGLLEQYNLNPSYFDDKITQLFENDVDPTKFERRLSVAYNTLFPQFDAVKQYYVQNYPAVFPTTEDITDEAIFASFIDEDVSADIISQRINVSQIGGAFQEQDFAISKEQAQRLVSAGLTGTGAQQLAQRAEASLGRLQRISQRFTGREDIFGLSEFIESEVFGEGVSQRLRERLEAEQATAFTREGGAAATQAGLTGLVEQ
jgi:hypothetical protein